MPEPRPDPNVINEGTPVYDSDRQVWKQTKRYADGRYEVWEWKAPEGGLLNRFPGPEEPWKLVRRGTDPDEAKAFDIRLRRWEDSQPKPVYREGEDGRIYLIDPDTNKATPVEGIPGKQPAPVSEQIVTSPPATQADIVVRDATGALVKRPNPLYDQAAAQQAEADRQRTIGAQQQSQQLAAQREALDQARFAWQKEQDAIRNQLANDRLSFDQARAAADEAHSRYTAQVSKLNLDVAQRGQGISMRNQEISTAAQLGSEASRAATASLPYLAPKGSTENISKAIGSLGSGGYKPVQYGAVPTAAFPFDPTNVGLDVTKQVLAGFMTGSGGFQAPPRPAPVNTAVQLPEPVFTAPG